MSVTCWPGSLKSEEFELHERAPQGRKPTGAAITAPASRRKLALDRRTGAPVHRHTDFRYGAVPSFSCCSPSRPRADSCSGCVTKFVREVDDPWTGLRVVALLDHTSLFEPVMTAIASNRLLWQIAAHGVLPVADKTLARPIVGRFFRFIARHVVRVTRRRDETWADVLERLHDAKALLVILPEGRMKRRTGLDLDGNPMTIRGGIADIIVSRDVSGEWRRIRLQRAERRRRHGVDGRWL